MSVDIQNNSKVDWSLRSRHRQHVAKAKNNSVNIFLDNSAFDLRDKHSIGPVNFHHNWIHIGNVQCSRRATLIASIDAS